MSCNCKTSGASTSSTGEVKSKTVVDNGLKYSAKIIGFLIGVLLLPLIMLGIIWFMFDTIVLNKEVDLTIILKKIVKINKAILDDDEVEDYEDLEEDEIGYITQNVEEIK
jgi:hypothetical protein